MDNFKKFKDEFNPVLIDTEITCKFCLKLLELPVKLPCSNYICIDDLLKRLIDDEREKEVKQIFCDICQQYHNLQVTKDSCFKIDKEKNDFIISYLCLSKRTAAKNLIHTIENQNKLNYTETDKKNYIYEYFENLRMKIKFQYSLLTVRAKNVFDSLINSTFEYQKECELSQLREIPKLKFDAIEWEDELRKPGLTIDRINQIIDELETLKLDLEKKIKNFENSFLNNACEFVSFDYNLLGDKLLGELKPFYSFSTNSSNDVNILEINKFFSYNESVNSIPDDLADIEVKDLFNIDKIFQNSENEDKKDKKKIKIDLNQIITDLHDSPVHTIKHIKDSLYASGSQDNALKLWLLGNPVKLLKKQNHAHKSSLECLAVTNDKKRLISGSFDSEIKVWSLYDKENNVELKHLVTLQGHYDKVWSLQILNDNLLASGSDDKTIRIWCLDKYKLKHILTGHTSSVHCLKKCHNGDLISSSEDNTIKIWNSNNNYSCIKTLKGHKKGIYFMDIMPNGNLITGSIDTHIKIWNIETGGCIKDINNKNQVHCLKYLGSGYLFVGRNPLPQNIKRNQNMNRYMCNIKILDINNSNYNLVKKFDADSHNVELSPDGYLFSCCSKENFIKVFKFTFD